MYSDLESDYINPIDLCSKLNQVRGALISGTDASQFTLPEMATHAFLTALFLINGQWIATLINLPLVIYNANK